LALSAEYQYPIKCRRHFVFFGVNSELACKINLVKRKKSLLLYMFAISASSHDSQAIGDLKKMAGSRCYPKSQCNRSSLVSITFDFTPSSFSICRLPSCKFAVVILSYMKLLSFLLNAFRLFESIIWFRALRRFRTTSWLTCQSCRQLPSEFKTNVFYLEE